MHRRAVSLSLPALALGLVWRDANAQPTPLAAADGGGQSGAHYPAFDHLGKKIDADYPDVDSVVVVRKGQVLFDHYKAAPDALRDVQSVTKSVLSLAVGAALGQGAIKSLDQPVRELLGGIEKGEPPVTVRHLLTMTAGFRAQERFASGIADDVAFLLGRERAEAPGTVFAYDNLSANLLSIVLEAATGQSASTFVERSVFRPLGITAYDWKKGSNGHSLGFSGLHLRTRDMVRIGELALSTGVWSNRQVVPEAYARSAVMSQNTGGRPVGLSYGFMWWVVPSAVERRTFLASGFGGQLIWVHPPLELVIATTCAVSGEANRRGQALALIRNELFRAASATNP